MSLYTSDHAPTDVETFYTELVETLDPWGLIIAAFVDETVALSEGNYIFLERDPLEIGQRIAAALRRAIGNKLEREYSN
jgi:hypothetical protein